MEFFFETGERMRLGGSARVGASMGAGWVSMESAGDLADRAKLVAIIKSSRIWTPLFKRLVRVVASYVALRQRYRSFVGRCPFCGGNLEVSPATKSCRCWDCEARHDAASFVMAMEGLDRTRAVKRLSARVWNPIVPIVYESRPIRPRLKPARKKRLKQICGAKNRRGEPCQRKEIFRGGKCPNHGGLSTGPKTPEGKALALANLRPYRKGHVHSDSWRRARKTRTKRPMPHPLPALTG
jgi:hypothetical protein